MSKIIDEVWTEEPGMMLKVTDNGGTISLSFHRGAVGEFDGTVFEANVALYRWKRLFPHLTEAYEQQSALIKRLAKAGENALRALEWFRNETNGGESSTEIELRNALSTIPPEHRDREEKK